MEHMSSSVLHSHDYLARPAIGGGPRRRSTREGRAQPAQRRRSVAREMRYAVVRVLLSAIALPCLLVWHFLKAAGVDLE